MTNLDPRIEALAAELVELRRLVSNRTPQLGQSAMEDGSIGEYITNPDGSQTIVGRYGTQYDGTHTAVSLAGPVPPTPSPPSVVGTPTGLLVRWDGTWAEGPTVVAPSDFARVELHVGIDPAGGSILFESLRGTIETPRGGEVPIVGLTADTDYYVWAVARTQSGKFGATSAVAGPVRTSKLAIESVDIDLSQLGGNTIHRGPSTPPGPNKIGDLWLKTPQNVAYRWEGDPADWVATPDTRIAEAIAEAFAAHATAKTKARIFSQASPPTGLGADDVDDEWIDTDDDNRRYTWTGTIWQVRQIGNSSIKPQSLIASDVVATGTVTAALLEAIMILANVILTAPATGPHVRIDNAGVTSYSVNPEGVVVPTSRFGGVGADRVLITDPVTGTARGTWDETGAISATSIAVNGPLLIRGNSLDFLLDRKPRGLVARAGIVQTTAATASANGVFDVEFLAEPGRAYRIHTSTLNPYGSVAGSYFYTALTYRPSAQGAPSLTAGTPFVGARGSSSIAGGADPVTLDRTLGFSELWGTDPVPTTPQKMRVLLVYGMVSGSGTCSLFAADAYPMHVYIEDVGPEVAFTGVVNAGGGTTGTPVLNYQRDFAATFAQTWSANRLTSRTDTFDMVQGQSPYDSYNGMQVGMFGFEDLTGILAGATINSAAVYVYANHWHNDVGGTAILGHHAYLNPPQSRPADWALGSIGLHTGIQKPGGMWHFLPANQLAALKTGATRGFTLGDMASTSTEYYGRFAGFGDARPVLRINWTK